MRGRGGVTRARLRAAAAALVGLLAFWIVVPAAGAGTPKPTPSSSSTHARAVPISLHVGGVNISVSVPLTLNGLLGKTPTAPPTTPTPPPIVTSSEPATQSSHHSSAPAHTQAYPPGTAGGGAAPAYARPGDTTQPTRSASAPAAASTTGPATKHHTANGLVLVKGFVPTSGSLLLVALCAACALGVVFVLKVSGRGRHKA